MEAASERPAFLADPRRSFRLLHPGTQLGLALHVLAVGAGFGLLLVWHAWHAYADLLARALDHAPAALEIQLRQQTESFAVVSLVMGVGYVLVVVGVCVAWSHRLLGPTVALRRHLQALRNGRRPGPLRLRRTDGPFLPVADALNEVTRLLEEPRDPRGLGGR